VTRRGPGITPVSALDDTSRLGEAAIERFEASGVVAVDGTFYVIFDNRSEIGCFGDALFPGDDHNRLVRHHFDRDTGYEDIAYDESSGRFFILIEALPHRRGFCAKVREYDSNFAYISSSWLDFPFAGPIKDLEGLACIRRGPQTYLLGLCKGNRYKHDKTSRRPGGGRIQVFAENQRRWDHVDTIRLPSWLPFKEYSSIALAGERLCIVSQESSALWVGTLAPTQWRVADDGAVYRFPRNGDGEKFYCNVEGVSWLSDTQIVVVSDKAKADQKQRCRSRDQSIHVFALPADAQ
jgi:hypothetical protein